MLVERPLWSLYAEGVLWARNVRQKPPWTLCALWEKKPPQQVSQLFFFSQKNTEEQNTQSFTETLSQPISQSVTANVSWKASVNSVCRRRSVGSKCAPKCSVNSVRSVRDKTPHCEYPTIFLSQKITEEQNTQGFTETLSQPISQNLTATFSWNVLWILYSEGVLWVRNSAQKCSVKSVSSVREKPPQRVVCVSSHRVGAFYFSQIYTEEQNTQRPTETLSQPISQNLTATFSSNAPWTLYAGGVLWARNCAQKCSVNSVPSVRDKIPQRER